MSPKNITSTVIATPRNRIKTIRKGLLEAKLQVQYAQGNLTGAFNTYNKIKSI
jgi:hypothetical protein